LYETGPKGPVSFGGFRGLARTSRSAFDPQYEVPGRFWYVQYNQKF